MTHRDMMRVTADEYRRMAEQQTDLKERKKFLSYASVYDALAARHEQGELFEVWPPQGSRRAG